MSRITAPASKLARALSTTATSSAAQPSRSTVVASAAAAPKLVSRVEITSNPTRRSFHPTPLAPSRSDPATLDYLVLPVPRTRGPGDSSMPIRMPLLPDSFESHHMPEPVVAPLAKPTIVVAAAQPEAVMPAALGAEMDGFVYEGVSLHLPSKKEAATTTTDADGAGGMIRDVWKGLVDEVGGPKVVL